MVAMDALDFMCIPLGGGDARAVCVFLRFFNLLWSKFWSPRQEIQAKPIFRLGKTLIFV